jgi:predicted acylesterase/phospholipase RssA
MLRALIEREITPDFIVGVSIGAWNGAWLAHRPDLEWVKSLEEVWHQVSRRSLDMVWWRAARNMMRRKPSLYEGGGLSRFIAQHLQVSNFEDLAVPLHTVAIDLTMGTKAVFSHGPLGPAVLASSAIPGVFPPVMINGRQHVDGGLVDPTGLDTAIELGARRVFVLDSGYAGRLPTPLGSMNASTGRAGRSSRWAAASRSSTCARAPGSYGTRWTSAPPGTTSRRAMDSPPRSSMPDAAAAGYSSWPLRPRRFITSRKIAPAATESKGPGRFGPCNVRP